MPQSKLAIRAGDIDRRATLLAPVYNEFEDEIVDWTPVVTVWASVVPNYSQEINESGRIVATLQGVITIRYRADIDARWRVQVDGQIWELFGPPINIGNHREQLQLNCKHVE